MTDSTPPRAPHSVSAADAVPDDGVVSAAVAVSGAGAIPAAAVPETEAAPAIVDVLLRPRVYFARPRRLTRKATVGVFLLVGISTAVDRAGNAATASSAQYWAAALAMAVVYGPLRWLVGRALFRARVRWSGGGLVDAAHSDAIFAWSELVYAVPTIAVAALNTFANPAPAQNGFSLTEILALGWSLVVAYQGVSGAFPVKPSRARLWFLVLPALLFGLVFGGTYFLPR